MLGPDVTAGHLLRQRAACVSTRTKTAGNMNRIEMPADMHAMLSSIMILDWFSAGVITGNN